MINHLTSGLDPSGRPFRSDSPGRPGIFLSREAATYQLGEYPAKDRRGWRVVERSIRGWWLEYGTLSGGIATNPPTTHQEII